MDSSYSPAGTTVFLVSQRKASRTFRGGTAVRRNLLLVQGNSYAVPRNSRRMAESGAILPLFEKLSGLGSRKREPARLADHTRPHAP